MAFAEQNEENELLAQVEAFEKFAKLVSEKMEVEVRFDGAQAHTDGKIIVLPNLLTMSPKEIDVLYAILLHEVGHVKYTDNDQWKEGLKKVDHFNAFQIINAIEDARIENKLMKVYGGADDIFDNLYNKVVLDAEYMKKIFKAEYEATPSWFNFSIMVHHYLLDLTMDEQATKWCKSPTILTMFNEVKPMIDAAKLNSTADVVALGIKLYNHFYKDKDDKSAKIDFLQKEKELEKSKKEVQALMAEIAEKAAEVAKIREKLRELRGENRSLSKDKDGYLKENKDVLSEAEKLRQEAGNEEWKLWREQSAKSHIDFLKSEVERLKKEIQELTDKMQKQSERQAEAEKKEKTARTPQGKEKQKKSAEHNKAQQEKNKQNIEALKETLKEMMQQLSEAEKNYQEAQKQAQGVNEEQVKQMAKNAQDMTAPIEKEVSEKFDAPMGKNSGEIQTEKGKLRAAEEAIKQAFKSKLNGLDQLLKGLQGEAGAQGQIIPAFEETPGWDEADGVQKEFDQDATSQTGMPVVNGMSPFGSDVRSMIARLTDVSDKLNSIDLAEIFQQRVHTSPLECVNDTETTNSAESADTRTFKSTRKHIPVTTRFDVVREEVTGGDVKEVPAIRKSMAIEIAKASAIIKRKLKFSAKPKFRGNREEGLLDPRNLWKIPSALSTQIFEERLKKFDNKVQAVIAIDLSGSMDKSETDFGQKAKELAIILSDALTSAHVKHEVVGFGAPLNGEMGNMKSSSTFNRRRHNLETVVFKNMNGASAMQNIKTKCWDNADGESLRVIAKRLMKNRSKKKIMFVISDNRPFLSDADIAVLDQDLKDAVVGLRRAGMEVYGMGWNKMGKDFYGDKYCQMGSDWTALHKFLDEKLQAERR